MSLSCVALKEQRTWRDLRRLEQSVQAVRWVDAHEAIAAPEVLVACGLWACRELAASQVLCERAKAGRSSLLVARFEPLDMGPVVGAPAGVQISPGETTALAWEDGQRFEVPGVTVIETAIAEGHWARSTAGTTVFAYRPHTQAGLMVLCTATVAGVALGADPAQQKALLQRILEETTRRTALRAGTDPSGSTVGVCSTAAEYLDHHGSDGALVLLAACGAADGRVSEASLEAIGATLPGDRLADLVAALPTASPEEMERALRAAGWGAHLRVLARRRTEDS